jgi:chemotaxis protein MotB
MARSRKKPEPDGGPGFLTTYADIVTLLMAFFVLLFAMSSIDQEKFLAVLKGLEEDFGNTAYDDHIIEGGAGLIADYEPLGLPISQADGTLTQESMEALAELAALAAYVEELTGMEASEDTEADIPESGILLDLEALQDLASRLAQVAADQGFLSAIELGFNERGLVVVLSTDDVLFTSGSAVLNPEVSERFLKPIAAELLGVTNPVYIEGHTDNAPLARSGYSNWDLSTDRALAVLDFFELVVEIDPARLVASGFGEYRPRVGGVSDDARRQNRRVELVVAFDNFESLDSFEPAVSPPSPEPGVNVALDSF